MSGVTSTQIQQLAPIHATEQVESKNPTAGDRTVATNSMPSTGPSSDTAAVNIASKQGSTPQEVKVNTNESISSKIDDWFNRIIDAFKKFLGVDVSSTLKCNP